MAKFAWERFLKRMSRYIIATGEFKDELTPEVIESDWLGYPGATEKQIVAAEKRLGIRLPPSYREFLRVTNGWRMVTNFIHKLWSVSEIGWHDERHREENDAWMEAWMEGGPVEDISDEEYRDYGRNPSSLSQPFRPQYLRTALEVSSWTDGIYLLNPQTINVDGEWEAWFFAPWNLGASRYPSFWDLLQGERRSFVHLMRRDRGRPTPYASPELGLASTDYRGLVKKLKLSDNRLRGLALNALSNLRDKRAVEPVLKIYLNSRENDDVRCDAARTLGDLRDARAIKPLLKWLRKHAGRSSDTVGGLRHATHQGLLGLGEVFPQDVFAALTDPNPLVRAELLEMLSYAHRVPGCFDEFVPRLTDSDRRVRAAAVKALTNTTRFGEVLTRVKRMARNDRSAEVRKAARTAVRDYSP